jgi:hypothetical protein
MADPTADPTPAPADPTPSPSDPIPAPLPTVDPAKILPFVNALRALATGRKGVIVLGAIAFCIVVYFKDPTKLTQLLAFLGVLLPSFFGAQAYEDGKKQEALATAKRFATPGQG